MSEQRPRIKADTAFEMHISEAQGFYNLLFAAASSFLGATLLFLQEFAPPKSTWSLVLLYLGWVSLAGCIVTLVGVRWMNLKASRLRLKGKVAESKLKLTCNRNRVLTKSSAVLLVLGILFLTCYGIINVGTVTSRKEGRAMSNDSDQNDKPQRIERAEGWDDIEVDSDNASDNGDDSADEES